MLRCAGSFVCVSSNVHTLAVPSFLFAPGTIEQCRGVKAQPGLIALTGQRCVVPSCVARLWMEGLGTTCDSVCTFACLEFIHTYQLH